MSSLRRDLVTIIAAMIGLMRRGRFVMELQALKLQGQGKSYVEDSARMNYMENVHLKEKFSVCSGAYRTRSSKGGIAREKMEISQTD